MSFGALIRKSRSVIRTSGPPPALACAPGHARKAASVAPRAEARTIAPRRRPCRKRRIQGESARLESGFSPKAESAPRAGEEPPRGDAADRRVEQLDRVQRR